ncbi:CGNR zinc finger domain-containing protein [Actinacidiphila acidipaludis]|uniref:ABATE domain-containing protein n=1 Tax=Actinacidiphila acidipaludis TaxID=2873382 RepID=A0ABS7Q868_9ACTN|nr:ABATE domain-containing protein [Streptomyces acidipaludis]MBY8879354.1 ABATE domain-containing protein [Streptomyces acidipaludis]
METTGPRTDGSPAGSAPLLPGEPLPVRLTNTLWADTGGVHDSLEDTAGLAAWLETIAPLLPGGAGDALAEPGDLTALLPGFRELRDALRVLAADVTDDTRPVAGSGGRVDPSATRAAAEAVDRACAHAPGWSHLAWPQDGPPTRVLRSAHEPAAAALSLIAEDAVRLFAGDDRTSLRACLAPGCVLYFLRTHPRREWCSAACGNRARVARHYQRHHAHPGT